MPAKRKSIASALDYVDTFCSLVNIETLDAK
jgi:hypothetical protein